MYINGSWLGSECSCSKTNLPMDFQAVVCLALCISISDSFAAMQIEFESVIMGKLAYIKENEPSGTFVAVVKVTKSEGRVVCTADSPFEILPEVNSEDGATEFTMVTTEPFDRELVDDVVAFVECTSLVGIVSRNLTVMLGDVNDESPVFSQQAYHFTISADASPGSTVGTLHAVDADEAPKFSKIKYFMAGDCEDVIDNNVDTGVIITMASLQNLRGTTCSMEAIAMDSGAPYNYADAVLEIAIL